MASNEPISTCDNDSSSGMDSDGRHCGIEAKQDLDKGAGLMK
jgi:hypothetical protein